MTWVTPFRG